VTHNVQAAYDRAVEEGAAAVSPPQTKPWGQDVAYVRDPDGNLVELASPV
jgi:lactoylglutathione lyase